MIINHIKSKQSKYNAFKFYIEFSQKNATSNVISVHEHVVKSFGEISDEIQLSFIFELYIFSDGCFAIITLPYSQPADGKEVC